MPPRTRPTNVEIKPETREWIEPELLALIHKVKHGKRRVLAYVTNAITEAWVDQNSIRKAAHMRRRKGYIAPGKILPERSE